MRTVSLYVHIPFCERRCPYCTFYHVPKTDRAMETRLVEGLIGEFRIAGADLGRQFQIPTVYFGGGTPSLLDHRSFEILIDEISPFLTAGSVEITVESNPEDVNERLMQNLSGIGVNRLSLGIQSMSSRAQNVLKRCTPRSNEQAVRIAKRYFQNISLDLLLGIPGGTARELEESLAAVDRFEPQHVSVYCLEPGGVIPPDTDDFFDRVDMERAADEYLLVCDRLRTRGFGHYEVSNFARSGFESRHNKVYWNGGEYLGIGPSAHSFIEGERYSNVPSIDQYLAEWPMFPRTVRRHEVRGETERRLEEIMLDLRTSVGTPLDRLKCNPRLVDELVDEDLASIVEERLVLTDRGYLVLNEIVHRLSGGPWAASA
ncbi:MAG: radical SAM family heme chaperone HemW [Candidatus Latescibacterota bacterium]|nr:MAG: radical SAM family heme chaperone HemW [Candidatus Latescibacterota bacterium]